MPMMLAMSGSNAMKRVLFAGLSTVALAGCTVGPTYHAPQVTAPATWRQTQPPAASRITTASADPQWWTLFHDPALIKLEREVAASNLDLKAASLRLMQSQAERRIASAAQMPHVEANASYGRERAAPTACWGCSARWNVSRQAPLLPACRGLALRVCPAVSATRRSICRNTA